LLVRNQDPITQVLESFNEFETLNIKLISEFLNKPKNVDPYIEEILQRDLCENLITLRATMMCLNGTNSATKGLLQLNTQYYMIVDYLYISMGKFTDITSAVQIFASAVEETILVITILVEIYPILISYIVDKFAKEEEKAEDYQFMFCGIICFFVIMYILFLFLKPFEISEKSMWEEEKF